ncbi:Flagellar biosynthesis pathway component [uncultured Desulfatiglans sp.]|nr:Flagellar biosynthesis pathway component [uncultured Desulfatiglans sp.]
MPQGSDQERTEQATPKRREDARKKGRVAQSREIPSVMILFAGLGIFFFAGGWVFSRLSVVMQWVFGQLIDRAELAAGDAELLLMSFFRETLLVMAPLALAVISAAVGANVLQKGFLFNMELLNPDISRLNPLKGIRRMASMKSLVELMKSVLKVAFIGGIGYLLVRSAMDEVLGLVWMEVPEILAFIGDTTFRCVLLITVPLVVLAVADLLFQHWEHERELRMTKQEIKDENKQREGDPFVKARIRRVQMEVARRRMMQAVKEADVVVTNPTHLAVALKYSPETMAAPQVVGKGAGFLAERIKRLAQENGIPVVENRILAQALYKGVEVGGMVPVALYRAVAEVMAYVYRLKGRRL